METSKLHVRSAGQGPNRSAAAVERKLGTPSGTASRPRCSRAIACTPSICTGTARRRHGRARNACVSKTTWLWWNRCLGPLLPCTWLATPTEVRSR